MKLLEKLIDTEVDEKLFKKLVLTAIIAIVIIVIILFLNNGLLRSYKAPSEEEQTGKQDEVVFTIDKVDVSRKYIGIEGWAYKKGRRIDYFKNRFVIRNEETKECKALKTQMKIINELYLIDYQYDCTRSGMIAKGIALGLKKGKYQVLIEYRNDGENILVETGKFFEYGK